MATEKRPRSLKMVMAKWAVEQAIEAGRLVRQPCETCGSTGADGHHDDYDFPLVVRWLCRRHHAAWHRLHGPGANGGEKTMAPAFRDVVRPSPGDRPHMSGHRGGHARAVALTPEQRSEVSRRAAEARWAKRSVA